MSEQHTPGPCTLREFDAVDGYFVLISDSSGDLFAKAFDIRKARMIAALPEMLAALRAALDEEDGHDTNMNWPAAARAAIAKATT